ncbi:unnamed protein product [Rotaria magnacalcarata]|uniref:Uncharacterized protein n=1 Tax=Rotaria magnacalcarata TaxID=392030 RepID=A0A815SIB8_9BILA|nr:unnamed protein product [Rotaria magnacalcarata]CAF5065579.1 unnamed protein product [Rotaria magnacalcarata]
MQSSSMPSTDPTRVIHSSKSNLELIHSANTVNYRSTPTIKLSHISSAHYRPRVTRVRRMRRQPIHYEDSWKQGISQLKKIPRTLPSPYHRRITPISQRKLVPVDGFMNFDGQITKVGPSSIDIKIIEGNILLYFLNFSQSTSG